jgi:hypothetical protein
MIQIEKINATQATVVRGGIRQPLLLNSHITEEELATVEAVTGTIMYSVDETEVKMLTFQAKPVNQPPTTKTPAARVVQPAAKVTQPNVAPTGTAAK